MFSKFDAALAIVAVFIFLHLGTVFTPENYHEALYDKDDEGLLVVDDDVEAEVEDDDEDEYVDQEEIDRLAEEARLEEEAEEERIAEERRQEDERREQAKREQEEAEEAERERIEALAAQNGVLAERLYNSLNQSMAGDPYNSDRYIRATVEADIDSTRDVHHIIVTVNESTFGRLNLELKTTVYEVISQEIQGLYQSYLETRPDELIIELVDSGGVNLSTYRHDIIGDRYVITVNHNNDNNF